MSKTDKRRSFTWLNYFIKFLVSILLGWVIYKQLTSNVSLIDQWSPFVSDKSAKSFILLFIVLCLMPFNLFSEVLKWNFLVAKIEKKHTLKKSFLAVMTGTTAAIITPGRIGEYFGRMMFVKAENNWKAVWANLLNSISLYIVIVIWGISALLYLFSQKLYIDIEITPTILSVLLGFCLLLLLFYFNFNFFYKLTLLFRKFSFFEKMINAVKAISEFPKTVLIKVLVISLVRYFIFVFQYLLVLLFFDFETDLILLVAAIAANFLILSAIPLPPLMGILARAEIALLIFSSFNDNELLILLSALTLWFINQVIPALIGLFIMFKVNIMKTFGYG